MPVAEPQTAVVGQRQTPSQEAGRGAAKARERKGTCRAALLGDQVVAPPETGTSLREGRTSQGETLKRLVWGGLREKVAS